MINLGKPKTKYYLKRILPFGIIWLALSWFVLLIESMATDYENKRPETDITVDWAIFLFASFAVFMVGIAMGTGTDVTIESAMITLVKGDLHGIVKAKNLSHAVMKNIKQNLFFALVYNTLGVPIAAGVLFPFFGILLSPMIAALAMSFSSVSVIGNALRLRTRKIE